MTDFYELLGIPPDAGAAEVRQAYVRLAKTRHPDRYPDPVEKENAQSFFKDLTTAFNTLVNEGSRRQYDASRARPTPRNAAEIASEAYARSAEVAESGDYQGAVTLLQTAVHHAPEVAEYHAALGRLLGKNPATARDAIQSLEKATHLAPSHGAYFADLAILFNNQGLRLRAQKALETAQRLAPRDPRVARLAAELGLPRA
jgi:curved DNA-binding protein CbpA